MDDRNENITILLISSSKLLKNKFIELLNTATGVNHFTLMIKTIESLKTSTERINVPCLICDYSIESEDSTKQTETNYVQLVDATDTSLINNLISRSINKDLNKNFQFYINAIIYLYDESSPDTFHYVKSIHTDIKKTFNDFISNNNLLFLICNMMDAATIGQNNRASLDNSTKLMGYLEKFLDEFNNIQYVSQAFEETILGTNPIIDNENGNKIKDNFDSLIARNISKIKLGLNKKKLTKKKQENQILNLKSETESVKSSEDSSSKINQKLTNLKKTYQGEMLHNLRNGNLPIKSLVSLLK